jgi:hypothetical protein
MLTSPKELLSSPEFPDIHYLPIETPGRLRPDAVSWFTLTRTIHITHTCLTACRRGLFAYHDRCWGSRRMVALHLAFCHTRNPTGSGGTLAIHDPTPGFGSKLAVVDLHREYIVSRNTLSYLYQELSKDPSPAVFIYSIDLSTNTVSAPAWTHPYVVFWCPWPM